MSELESKNKDSDAIRPWEDLVIEGVRDEKLLAEAWGRRQAEIQAALEEIEAGNYEEINPDDWED